MATFIVLASFTDLGIRNVKDTTKRADAFANLAKKHGAALKDIYWTIGRYDLVAIVEAPDAATLTALGLTLGKTGNVRTETLSGFSRAEMDAILSKVE
ncbi:MAG TPA: GYD domain-containing protein [Xanthobacteraceae bacterium]